MPAFGTIMLTGTHGQVGSVLQTDLGVLGNVIGVARAQLDLTDADAIRRMVRELRPGLIVNPAAYTAVDKAEAEPELAFAINAEAPRILAEEAARLAIPLVHFSTDYVFDGRKTEAYIESDNPHPLGVYGQSKLTGEEAIRASGVQHLILRTSWVYGAHGNNFMKTMIRLATQRESLRVVADQFGAPTSSHTIAAATCRALIDWRPTVSGTYHLTNRGRTSWHGFAQAILGHYQRLQASRGWPPLRVEPEAVIAIGTADYPTAATRPANSCLDCSKFVATFGNGLPDWQEALDAEMQALHMELPSA